MFGFKTQQEYYEDISADNWMSQITVPLFSLQARDDNLGIYEDTPWKDVECKNSMICVSFTTNGGHASHLTGSFLPRVWYQEPCLEFLNFMESKLAPKIAN